MANTKRRQFVILAAPQRENPVDGAQAAEFVTICFKRPLKRLKVESKVESKARSCHHRCELRKHSPAAAARLSGQPDRRGHVKARKTETRRGFEPGKHAAGRSYSVCADCLRLSLAGSREWRSSLCTQRRETARGPSESH
jgi:hypothetical protein